MFEHMLELFTYVLIVAMIVSLWAGDYRFKHPILVSVQTFEVAEIAFYAVLKFVVRYHPLTFAAYNDIRQVNYLLDVYLLCCMWMEFEFLLVNLLLLTHTVLKAAIYYRVDTWEQIGHGTVPLLADITDTVLIMTIIAVSWNYHLRARRLGDRCCPRLHRPRHHHRPHRRVVPWLGLP